RLPPTRASAGHRWRSALEHRGRNVSIEVKVPQLPESVTDATLVNWHKKAGDAVRRDENLVDLETDKVVLEVPAPTDGIIKEIRVGDGATVTSGQVLAVLEPGEVGAEAESGSAPERQAEPAEPRRGGPRAPAAAVAAEARAARSGAGRQRSDSPTALQKMGPAVRKRGEEHDIDPTAIRGSGREGRVTK